jgi:putative hemolysin
MAISALHKPAEHITQLEAYITTDFQDIESAFRLRHSVFSEDFDTHLTSQSDGLDKDQFDDYCHHLIVKDCDTQQVVAYSRIITHDLAMNHKGFYTATEFDLTAILDPSKRYMEIGRTCIHKDYRRGAAIGMLWGSIGKFMLDHQMDYLMGCASIDVSQGLEKAHSALSYLRTKYFSRDDQRVIPKEPLPFRPHEVAGKQYIPPILQAYLRMGCKVCGEAHWDQAFNVADVMVLLKQSDINMRYLKHFLRV